MSDHHHNKEEHKPSNRWISTPIILAIIVVACVTGLLSMVSGSCSGHCKKDDHNTHQTEQHDEHGTTEHSDKKENTGTSHDTTATENHEGHEGHENHEGAEHEGHGH